MTSPTTPAGRRLMQWATDDIPMDVMNETVLAIEAEARRLTVEQIRRVLEPLADEFDTYAGREGNPVWAVAADHLRSRWRIAHDAAMGVAALNASESPPPHMRQSSNGCVTCSRRWSDHSDAERGDASESGR